MPDFKGLNTAYRYIRQKNYAEAEALLDKVISVSSSTRAFVLRAFCRFKMGNFNGAVEDSTKAIEGQSNISDLYLMRGLSFGSMGRLEDAISDFKIALELNPDDRKSWWNLLVARQKLAEKSPEIGWKAIISAQTLEKNDKIDCRETQAD